MRRWPLENRSQQLEDEKVAAENRSQQLEDEKVAAENRSQQLEDEKILSVKKMISHGIDVKIISACTGFSESEIRDLKSSMN